MPVRAAIVALLLLSGRILPAASLSAIVKDATGSLVAGAAVLAASNSTPAPLQAATDAAGRVQFDSVPPGSYRVSVTKEGFEPWERTVAVADKRVDLNVSLKLSVVTTTVQVSGRRSALANSDPNYTALRQGKLTRVYTVSNLVLKRDVGTFTFRSGSFSFLPPVLGQVAAGVFVGDGNFQLKPAFDIAVQHLHRITGADSVDEDFSAMVVYFTDSTFDDIKQHSELADESPKRHEEAFQRVKNVIETRREPRSPLMRNCCPPLRRPSLSPLERLLNYEDIPNYDAEILAELYNPAQRGSFRAFLHGKKHSGLRFLLNPSGALPMLPAPEEIALLDFDPDSDLDGIWYLSHFDKELLSGRASSKEDKRLIAPEHYRIHTVIGKENLIGGVPDLSVTCDLRFRALADGTRMVKFSLVPDLQMTRVSWDGKEIPFVQESRKHDGSFYLQMPEALVKGRNYQLSFEYSGGEILQSTLGPVPPRRVWYPMPAGAASRATYDLTFLIPHGSTIVSVGRLAEQSREGSFDVSRWLCDVPITQASFRHLVDIAYKSATDEVTNVQASVYVKSATVRGIIPPSSGNILTDTGSILRLFNSWFGKPSHETLAVVVDNGTPADSMPGVVYAPPVTVAGYSSLASQMMVRSGGRRGPPPGQAVTTLDEAFARGIALQWWGNTVSSASFHDAWLSGGFANFSTSIYDSAANNADEYKEHWVNARRLLLTPNEYGVKPNDAGPVWMGLLNETYKTERSSGILTTFKGGYILHMLRSMMWEGKTGDADFRAMMQDYVTQFANQTATTRDFQTVVEKHMKPSMDLAHNHRMDWFFAEWLFGTDVPSYRMEYTLSPDAGGKTLLTVNLTQSGVSPGFAMLVPVFGEFHGKMSRVATAAMVGNGTGEFKVQLPEAPKRVLLNLNHDVLTDREEVKRKTEPRP
jgi:hypothetical protein